jgi:hypothetical protein
VGSPFRKFVEGEFVTPNMPTIHPGSIPIGIQLVLERSGIFGYMADELPRGGQAIQRLCESIRRAVSGDPLLPQLEPELALRSLTTGWARICLDPTENNAVAVWADNYYRTLMAAYRHEGPQSRPVSTTGVPGFQEQELPDWDLAVGKLIGYRKWALTIPGPWEEEDVAIFGELPHMDLHGSYGKDFLEHETDDLHRHKAVCYGTGAHKEVPADNGCGCGWWVYWSPKEADKHAGGGGLANIPVTVATEGSGRVVIGQKGFRCEWIKIIGIAPSMPGHTRIHGDPMTSPLVYDIDQIRKFARQYLPGCEVFENSVEMKKLIGVDPTYGTMGSRYPELSHYDDRTLSTYMQFLRRLQGGVRDAQKENRTRLGAYMQRNEEEDPYVNSLRDEQKSLKIAHQLLTSEYLISDYLLLERGTNGSDLYQQMVADDWARRDLESWDKDF